MSTIFYEVRGTLEALGKTILGDVGVGIRTADGKLIMVPVPKDELVKLSSLLYEPVRLTIESAT